jgi:predicted permease
MQIFNITLNQMLVLFTFMAVGFFLNKKNLLTKETSKVLSKLETYLFLPCLSFQTFYKNCTLDNLITTSRYLIYGTAILLVSFGVALLMSRLFAKDRYTKNVYVYSFTIPNLGFMGNALVLGVFGPEVLFQYMMFYLPSQIYIYTHGLYSLVPKESGSKFSFKTLINPPLIGILIGAIFGIFQIPIPGFLMTGISSASSCMSPIAMVIAGFVIGNYSLKTLASNYRIYIASLIRLVAMPIVFVLALKGINTNPDIVRAALCSTALPFGLNTIVFPEAYGGDATPGASMALISHLISVITLPLIFGLLL